METTEPEIQHLRVTNPGHFIASATLEAGEVMELVPSMLEIDGFETQDIAHSTDCEVTVLVDGGESTQSITYKTFTGSGVETKTGIKLLSADMRLRVTNTSGQSGADFFVTGNELY